MQLFTKEQPVYLPEKGQKSVLRLGLQPMPASQWMMVDGDFPVFQQNKLGIKRRHANKVYSAVAGSEPAQSEFHSPVPAYQNKLADRVNRLLDKLTINKPVLRYNWSVQQGNELYWRDEVEEMSNPADAYWRVERQTLRRLPETEAIVFSIRIYLHSFTELAKRKSFALDLQSLCSQLPRQEKLYKGL